MFGDGLILLSELCSVKISSLCWTLLAWTKLSFLDSLFKTLITHDKIKENGVII